MRNLKLGGVVCGLMGVVGCFLPMAPGMSYFETRHFDAGNAYVVLVGFATALAIGLMGMSRGMQRWMSVVSIAAFAFVVFAVRPGLVEFLKAGIGTKLIGVAALAGLAIAILTTVKPEPAIRS